MLARHPGQGALPGRTYRLNRGPMGAPLLADERDMTVRCVRDARPKLRRDMVTRTGWGGCGEVSRRAVMNELMLGKWRTDSLDVTSHPSTEPPALYSARFTAHHHVRNDAALSGTIAASKRSCIGLMSVVYVLEPPTNLHVVVAVSCSVRYNTLVSLSAAVGAEKSRNPYCAL